MASGLFYFCGHALLGKGVQEQIWGPWFMTVATTTEVEERHSREAIEAEIARFEERAQQLRRGEITEEQFRPFRLKHGTYGQRQPGFQMLRVKVAAGVVKPSQLRVLAQIADEYSTGRGHLTTRENVQFHFVQLEDVPAAMRLLSGCADDGGCAVAGIHDVGLIAQMRGSNGTARRGFKVLVGGGLGSLPTESAVLTEFLPEEELLPTIEAVLRVFSETGNRKNKFK